MKPAQQPARRPRPAPTSREATLKGASVQFRSGRSAFVISPDAPTLQALWQAAHEDRPGARWALVRVALTHRPRWPEREELVDLTAIESVILP